MTRLAAWFHLLPPGSSPDVIPMLWGKGIRAFADGFVAVLLPVYLLKLGFDAVAVGLISTVTLFGSAVMTLGVGMLGHHLGPRRLLLGAALIMATTGLGFLVSESLWPLLVVAFVGTLNPTGGDVSVFLPLDHAVLAHAVPDEHRTALFARYSLIGSLCGALGALCAGLPDMIGVFGISQLASLRGMFGLYAVIGLACFPLYQRLRSQGETDGRQRPLGPSRHMVYWMATLFSLDAFAGGLIIRSLLVLWLFQSFGLSVGMAGVFFFASDLLTAVSYLVAVPISRRFGLINTMVFTHTPSSICLILAALSSSREIALGLLLVRSLLSQMDVPTRSSYVMAVVSPAERPAAAAITSVPRSLASAASPALAGALMAAATPALPLILCGGLKIAYDLMLLLSFQKHRPPEERLP